MTCDWCYRPILKYGLCLKHIKSLADAGVEWAKEVVGETDFKK